MATKVFTEKKVGDKYNISFINYKIDAEKGEGITLAKNFGVAAYPTYLFVNGGGELIYQFMGAVPPDKLLEEADKATLANKNFKPLEILDLEYKNGNRTSEFLYEYLKRKNVNGAGNAALLDEYLKATPESLYKTEKVLSMIAENVGMIDSKAFMILKSSLDRYLNMTSQQQQYIMTGITKAKRNTFKKILDTHDKALLEKLIEAVKATSYSPAGFEAEEKQFRLDYAKITRDGENFKKIAVKESAKLMAKTDKDLILETEARIKNFKEGANAKNIDPNSPQYNMILENLTDNAQKTTSFQLNEYAWGYFQMINNTTDLNDALKWAERAIELQESPANLDTYANLLNKIGRKKDVFKRLKGQ